jgi:hypothetical protein
MFFEIKMDLLLVNSNSKSIFNNLNILKKIIYNSKHQMSKRLPTLLI